MQARSSADAPCRSSAGSLASLLFALGRVAAVNAAAAVALIVLRAGE